jgi:hypothetical protein
MTAEASTERTERTERATGMTWSITESGWTDPTGEHFEYSVDDADGTIVSGIKSRELAEDIAAIPLMKQMLQNGIGAKLVPVQRHDERSDHAVLVSIAQLLEESLRVQRHVLAKVAQSTDSRSSVEVKTSTRGVDIAAKSYADSDVSAQVTPAVLAYFDTLEQVQARLNGEQS